MKKLLILSFAIIAVVMLTGCEESVTLDTPDVDYTVTDEGATLSLSWIEITDADGYIIYADGDSIDEVTTTAYDATVPAAEYEVTAYAGEDESNPATIDCAPVITTGLEVWGNTDPDTAHPSGFGFNTSGTAVAYALSNSANHPLIDFYINSAVSPMEFWSPHHHSPPYNDEVNAMANSGTTDFDAFDIADAPGGYLTQEDIAANAVYSFWIDPTNNGWDDATDYFGKLQVEGINGLLVTMQVAFQPISGLRWCVTP
jgi:hypothetical protein